MIPNLFIPRPYQSEAHDRTYREWQDVCATMITCPTGGGKTCIFALIIKSFLARNPGKRVLVVAHREELIWQARTKIDAIAGVDCGIEMGELSVSPTLFGHSPVVVTTIQTQNSSWGDRKRMGRFNPSEFGLLIIDECHHATADSYRNLIHYYCHNNPAVRVLGVTATPDRGDEEALGQVFQSVAFNYEILDAIHDGWLVPIDQQFVQISGLDFSHMRTTAGDLNGADLAAVMENEKNMQGVAGATIEIVGDRRAIVFAASVKQAETVSNILNRHRAGMAAWVCGATNKDARREVNRQFESGKIQVLCNCAVYTEGYDNPLIEAVIMARPTESRSLYAQMAGRGTRPLPGLVDGIDTSDGRRIAIAGSPKPSCLIVDFVGNSGKHKLVSSADLLGGKVSDEVVRRAVIRARNTGGAVRMSEVIDEEESNLSKEIEQRRLAEEARKSKLVAKVNYATKAISPFDIFQISPVKERGWDKGKNISDKQKSILLRQGINPDKMPYGQAKQLLNAIFERWEKKMATLPQLKVLARYGYKNPHMTFEEASKTLDALSKNNWKRT